MCDNQNITNLVIVKETSFFLLDNSQTNSQLQSSNPMEQRQQDELEFLTAAYTPEEAWWTLEKDDCDQGLPHVFRRLVIDHHCGDEEAAPRSLRFSLQLEIVMPTDYPDQSSLFVSVKVLQQQSAFIAKVTYDVLVPSLLSHCREVAESMQGSEALFAVLSAADEWIQGECQTLLETSLRELDSSTTTTRSMGEREPASTTTMTMGRRLIYSHHIISKKKRADMKHLASELRLTGYVKIGWPGLIIIEGNEDQCQQFYDSIRRWAWQYLVVRGEMQEEVASDCMDRWKCFDQFLEVDDMSIVAEHCRKVGLEALFLTSLKVYDSPSDNDNGTKAGAKNHMYGALIRVDHMNDGKSYRKWLRKCSDQLGLGLLLKECVAERGDLECDGPTTSTSRRPPHIIVALIGDDSSNVSSFLKKWRTTRVDVDSRGRPCLERMMTVLIEGPLERKRSIDRLDWESANSDDQRLMTFQELLPLIESIGGSEWVAILKTLINKTV